MSDDEKQIGMHLPVQVLRVIDGDTVEARIPIVARVRLLDCWAPEAGTPEGQQSTEHLKALCREDDGNGIIEIPIGSKGLSDLFSFGRILGYIEVAEQDLSAAQVAAGHATRTKEGRSAE